MGFIADKIVIRDKYRSPPTQVKQFLQFRQNLIRVSYNAVCGRII